ncbi:MAG: chromate transporter, partial [Clostridia bacterium]|nr:chromate transporter [Clostridia bacterium]
MKELLTLFGLFFKIGIMTFGGGYAMLPMLERELVVKRNYVTMEVIMDYFAVGQC